MIKNESNYLNYLKYELNYSDYTINEYFLHIKKYFSFLEKNSINYLEINKETIINYLKYLDSMNLTNRTIANILSSIRNYYDFLLDQNLIKTNIFKLISNPKLAKNIPNFLSYEDMSKILDSIIENTWLDVRNKLIIELLYSTGIRVSELVNIKMNDIDFDNNSIRILGKGSKERIVYFGHYAYDAIENYLKVRVYSNEYLILNSKGNKITPRGIEKIIDKIALNCSLKINVSPHTFRHTFATHLLNGGADIKSVQELLGHNSLSTTEIYTHITSEYLKNEYRKNMPR